MTIMQRPLPRPAAPVTALHQEASAYLKRNGSTLGNVLRSLGLTKGPNVGPTGPAPVPPRASRPSLG